MANGRPKPTPDSTKKKKPHFFKVYFPSTSSKRLVIPPSFCKHIEHEPSPARASLTGPSGNAWHCTMTRNDAGGVSFSDGWEEFAGVHSLASGDFLVFRYEGDLLFTVLIFDSTACEREEAFGVMPCLPDVTILGRGDEDEERSGREDCSIEVTNPETDDSKDNFRSPSSEKAKTCQCSGASTMQLQGVIKIEAEEVPGPCHSDEYHTQNSRGQTMKCGILSLKRPSNGKPIRNSRGLPRRHRIESRRRLVTEEEKRKALEAANSFQSQHPFFVTIMRESYVYFGFYMSLPIAFKNHVPERDAEMILWDPMGRSWAVKYNFCQGRGAFSAGWVTLSRANKLEKDDVCVFELFKPNEVRVHIFRVVEEITPSILSTTPRSS